MNKLVLDCESTGKNPYVAEIIEAYFKLYDHEWNFVNDHYFKSQVNNWSNDAELVHKISFSKMQSYSDKKTALDKLSGYLSSCGSFEVYLYANPKTELGFLYYDIALLQMELMNHLEVDRVELQPFKPQRINSVYDFAVECRKNGYFTPIKKDNGRDDMRLTGVYKALFDKSFNAHNCVDDVEATLKILFELDKRKKSGIINRDQLELI